MELDEASAEGSRWARDDAEVVWCDSAAGLLQAVQDGITKVEVGAVTEPGPLLDAVTQVAPYLDGLSLTGCNLDDAALARLAGALGTTQIQGVGVSNNPGISVQAWTAFWARLPATIARWDLGDNGLPDEVLPSLATCLLRGEVRELFLDGNELSDIGPLLPLVSESCGLAELDLGDNNVSDEQLRRLAEVLPGSAVTTLVLGRNPISDAGAVPLAHVLPRTGLVILHLDSTQIGDATLDALTAGLAKCSLEELHIDETRVGDAGVLRLCKMLPSSSISLLDAGDNNLSEETVAAIAAALPDDVRVE